MINMFSLVHGRANFIPPATNIDHVNVLELLSSKESKGTRIFGEGCGTQKPPLYGGDPSAGRHAGACRGARTAAAAAASTSAHC